MLTAVIAGRIFGGNLSRSCLFLKEQNYCPNMLSKSRFNRRLHQIPEELWIAIMRTFCKKEVDQRYVVDSFPVPTYQMARRHRVELFYGDHFLGYNASHKQWYVGLKVHLLITAGAQPLSLMISLGSEHDLTRLKLMRSHCPPEAYCMEIKPIPIMLGKKSCFKIEILCS